MFVVLGVELIFSCRATALFFETSGVLLIDLVFGNSRGLEELLGRQGEEEVEEDVEEDEEEGLGIWGKP